MAWSSNMNTSNQYIKYQIGIDLRSQNVANNTSSVNVYVRVFRTNTGYNTHGSGTVYCKIDGVTYSAAITSSQYINENGIVLFNKNVTINHNSNGTKRLGVSAWINHAMFSSSEQGYSEDLTTIPRATTPTLSSSSVDFGKQLVITLPRASSEFLHKLTYKFGKASGTISENATTSANWTVPIDLAKQIPTAESGIVTITCQTFVQTGFAPTIIGEKSITFTGLVPDDAIPTISAIATSDPNGHLATYGAFLQNKSKLKVAVTAAGTLGSTIKSISINALGVTANVNPWTSNVITELGGRKTITVSVVDSRNRNYSSTANFQVYDYVSPVIKALNASRCDGSGNADDAGDHIKISYNGEITPIQNKNSKRMVVQYKEQEASTWTIAQEITDSYTKASSVIVPADTEKTFDIRFTVIDAFESVERNWRVSSAYTLMDFNSSGKGMAIGKVSERDMLEIAMPTLFSGDLKSLKGLHEYGDGTNVEWHNKTGLNWFMFRGANMETLKLPNENCIVLAMTPSNDRGVALCISWTKFAGSRRIWMNSLHDDTQSFVWTGWKLIVSD